MAAYDTPGEQAARLAVDTINAEGGVAGRQIEITYKNAASDQQTGSTAAQELIAQGADILLVSADYDMGSPAAIAAQSAGVVAMSTGAGSPLFGVDGVGDLAFTMGDVTPLVASISAEWAVNQGWTKTALLCDQSIEYTTSLCDYYKEAFEGAGGEVVAEENFQNDDTSIAQQLTRLGSVDADVIYLPTVNPGGAAAVRQIRSAGIDLPVVAADAMEGDEWLSSVPGLSDFYLPAYGYIWSPEGDTEEVAEFLEMHEAEYGGLPTSSSAMNGYAAVQMLAAAIEEAGGSTNGKDLAAALVSVGSVPTLIGDTEFTESYHFALNRRMAILEVKDGGLHFVEHFSAENPVDPNF